MNNPAAETLMARLGLSQAPFTEKAWRKQLASIGLSPRQRDHVMRIFATNGIVPEPMSAWARLRMFFNLREWLA